MKNTMRWLTLVFSWTAVGTESSTTINKISINLTLELLFTTHYIPLYSTCFAQGKLGHTAKYVRYNDAVAGNDKRQITALFDWWS